MTVKKTTLERRQRSKEQLARLKSEAQDLWHRHCQKGRYIKCLEEEIADLRKRAKKNRRFVEPSCEWCENGFCCSHGVFPDDVLFEFQRQEEAFANANNLLQHVCYPHDYFPDNALFPQSQEEALASADNLLQHLFAAPEDKPIASNSTTTKKKLSVAKNDREATSHITMNSGDDEEDHAKRSSIDANYGDWTAFSASDHLDHKSDLEKLHAACEDVRLEQEDIRLEQEDKEFLLSKQDEWERAHWEAKASEQAPVSVLVKSVVPEVKASGPYQSIEEDRRDYDRIMAAVREDKRKRAKCGCIDATTPFHVCVPKCVETGCNGNCLSKSDLALQEGERQEYRRALQAKEEASRKAAEDAVWARIVNAPPQSSSSSSAWSGTYDGRVLVAKERADLARKKSEELLLAEASRKAERTANQCGPCGGIGCIFCRNRPQG